MIDELDLALVDALRVDPRAPWSKLAGPLGVDPATLSRRWALTPVPGRGHAPAERFLLDGGPATVGVIAAVTAPFCAGCDRLRLTADGQLRNCLFAKDELDLAAVLRGGGDDEAIDAMLRRSVEAKLPGHGINDPGFLQPARGMNAIGG